MPDRDVGRGYMSKQTGFSAAVSLLALVASAPAWGQSTGANDTAATDTIAEAPQDAEDAIVVTGVRRSPERAADIKRDSVQVVDEIGQASGGARGCRDG